MNHVIDQTAARVAAITARHHHRLDEMTGKDAAEDRRAVLEILTGERRPIAKCGIGEVMREASRAFADVIDPTRCRAYNYERVRDHLVAASAAFCDPAS